MAAETPGGLATVSMEQVLRWDPDVIITIDQTFAASVRDNPLWRGVRAVREGRVHLAPKLPFGWVDFPLGVNRLIGLWWLGKVVYPDLFPEDMRPLTREFYQRLYQVTVNDAQLGRILAGRGSVMRAARSAWPGAGLRQWYWRRVSSSRSRRAATPLEAAPL